jgi:hypothetical protein
MMITNIASTTSSTSSIDSVKRYLYPAIVAVVAGIVGTVAFVSGGRAPVFFLVAATAALGGIVWLLFRAGLALTQVPESEPIVVTGARRKELEREKQALLKALKELDFDHEMGKVSKKDFEEISQQYRARAIRVMRQLDDAAGDYEKMIARDLAARLGKPTGTGDTVMASAAAAIVAAPLGACAKCNTRNDDDAEFCKKCGAKLRAEALS